MSIYFIVPKKEETAMLEIPERIRTTLFDIISEMQNDDATDKEIVETITELIQSGQLKYGSPQDDTPVELN